MRRLRKPTLSHALHSLPLLALSFLLLPLSTFIVFLSDALSLFSPSPALRKRHDLLAHPPPHFRPRTIVITGIGSSKGLILARLFFLAGHHVIGADVEPPFLPTSSSRLSRAIRSFQKLPRAHSTAAEQQHYASRVVDIAWREAADLWISCSDESFADADGMAKELLEARTSCRSTQLDGPTVRKMLKDHSFIQYTKSIGLPVPETRKVTSRAALLKFLAEVGDSGARYVLKYVGSTETPNSDLTVVPFETIAQTKAYVSRLEISEQTPWILQQYINGPEFWAYSFAVRGGVKAFVACPASDSLTHYEALDPSSALSRSMLRFMQEFAAERGPTFTGHISIEFLVEKAEAEAARRKSATDVRLHPIKCSPHVHPAVCLFRDTVEELPAAYLSVLGPEPKPVHVEKIPNGTAAEPVFPHAAQKQYWVGQDLIQLVMMPVLSAIRHKRADVRSVLENLATFVEHVLWWKEGVFEIYDPWPAWWFYHVQWPLQVLEALVRRQQWVSINVTTGEMVTR